MKTNHQGARPSRELGFLVAAILAGGVVSLRAAVFTVSNTADSGPGTLRQAITDANATSGSHTISCTNLSGTITLSSLLPALTRDMEIRGPGAAQLTINGSNKFRVFQIEPSANVAISAVTISNASAEIGGGIFTRGMLALNHSVLTANTASGGSGWLGSSPGYGGGMYIESGSVTISNSTFAGNKVFGGWGSDGMNWTGNPARGGALFVNQGTLLMANSSVYGNESKGTLDAWRYGSRGYSGMGGGIYFNTDSVGNLWNCTVSGNVARGADAYCTATNGSAGGALGGGIYSASSNVFLVNCTIYLNTLVPGTISPPCPSGGAYGAGVYVDWYGRVMTMNSIIQDSRGNVTSQGHNLFAPAVTWEPLQPPDIVDSTFTLGPLQNNGGPTLTHALPTNSPAIDSGASAGAPAFDQRGVARPQSFSVDIGAFELVASGPPQILSLSSNQTVIGGTNATIQVRAWAGQPARLQWFKNGVLVPGATNATLSFPNTRFVDSGDFAVVVSNAFGRVSSAVTKLTVLDPAITVQPTSQSRNAGESATFIVTAVGTAPIAYQWWNGGVALTGAIGVSLTLTNLQAGDAGNYRVVVSNQYSSVTSAVAQLTVNLVTVDDGFNPGARGSASSLAVQADEKILLSGYFTMLGGQPRSYIARLNANGTLDNGFNPGASSIVSSLAVQTDGGILAAGYFTALGGQPHNYIARLTEDGILDNGFNPVANGVVFALAMQADGKALVGGDFTTLAGQPRNYIARLNADGTLDGGFDPRLEGDHPYPYVSALAVQADGKILLGGDFTTVAGQPRTNIARLNIDGTLDSGFSPSVNSYVYFLAVQADGKTLVGGSFTTMAGQPRRYIARLNADGTLDNGFNPELERSNGITPSLSSLAIQADGKILIGGYFTTVGGQPRTNIARLNIDGTLDSGFSPGADIGVASVAVQANGQILIGGWFTTLAGQPRTNIARLNNTGPATQNLVHNGSTITWLRGGTSPEVWRTTFEFSTNGSNWTLLGSGARIPGGWRLTGISLPPDGILRARGYVSGSDESSGWFVETVLNLGAPRNPAIVVNDGQFGIRSNRFGFTITGSSAASVVVDTSTNLNHWTPLATNSFGAGAIYFSDPVWPQTPQRFYRVRTWP